MKLKKGDKVKIKTGKDRGRTGLIEKVFLKEGTVLVKGINIYKKHVKSRGKDQPGGIIEMARPLPVAKVVLVCPNCKQATRVGYQLSNDKSKKRVCRGCQKLIDG